MPCTDAAVHAFQHKRVMFAPGKAANAGGVAMSGLEMSQNSARLHRSAEDLRLALKQIMGDIHAACVKNGRREDGTTDYVRGANVAGFRKVADAMLAFGVV
jgi:glutamate dehydrogenase (NADP+)